MDAERIAFEIKSFIGLSVVQDLKEALGQFVLYTDALLDLPSIPIERSSSLCGKRLTTMCFSKSGRRLLKRCLLRLVVFYPYSEEIVALIRSSDTARLLEPL